MCQMVSGHSSKYISIIFDLGSTVIPPEGLDCQSFGLGYMTLPESEHEIEGRMYRQHQYDMPPLSVALTGCIVRAAVSVEYHEDDEMRFSLPAGDLINDDNQVRSSRQ